jgi:hypothetical protein
MSEKILEGISSMANIKLKDINNLESWNAKELRKLRMNLRNRINSLDFTPNPKDLAASHPLHGLESGECKALLEKVMRTEKLSTK